MEEGRMGLGLEGVHFMKVRPVMRAGVRRAFSLLEVMLVLTIIAIMTAAVAYNLIGAGERAKIKASTTMLGTIQNAIKEFQMTNNAPPPNLEALQAGGKLALLDKDKKIVDAWERPFVYSPNPAGGHDYQLFSKGPDGIFPSADDLDVWKLGAK
jgi:general secretion pathway protein G